MELEFHGTRVYETRVPCDINLIACVSNTFTTFSQLSHPTWPWQKKEKKRNPHLEANERKKNLDRSWKNKKLKEIERCAIVGVQLLTVWLVWELGSVSYMVLECIKLK